ncbi:MAG TPA: pyrophosphate--fructose-6-phosphate 1-phosphotransferase [Sphingomicrobium sp.]|nr:pyrophosphate--fructose-6-phosphate 1-phosphotransferase [Sphingomicrobium sp.]
MPVSTVAMLTAGGLAPCLSSTVAGLIQRYTEVAPDVRIIAYLNGYAGLLTGKSAEVTDKMRATAGRLHAFGGSPIGNSRVRLTNVDDCVSKGLVHPGENPLHVAAEQLRRDGVDVLHTIGGDDTNGTAADLAAYLRSHGYHLTVVGLPKTIDNDVVPIRQTLGAWSAAEQGALYARNIIAECSSNPRMLIVHEVMGRNCGWLTAATALAHHEWVHDAQFAEWLENSAARWDVHGVYVPELPLDIAEEAKRLRSIMDEKGGVNLFISKVPACAKLSLPWRRQATRCRAILSAMSSSTRSTRANGSLSSSRPNSPPKKCWSKRAVTSPVQRPRTRPTSR